MTDISAPAARPEAGDSATDSPVLAMRGIHKYFGGVHALRGAEFVVPHAGRVYGLVGQNGSGKSTLLGILSGQVRPDAGEIILGGERVHLRGPQVALQHGIAMVSQESAVAPHLTVAENILLGRGLVRGRLGINWRQTRARCLEYLERLQLDYDPRWLVGDLRPDQRQMVEIARALSSNARILILDEPTSSLTDKEVVGLFTAIRHLKRHGVSTVYVSHRMSEIFEIVDELTVLRDGVTVDGGAVRRFTHDSLVQAMIGEVGKARRPGTATAGHKPRPSTAPVLSIRGLEVDSCLHDLTFDVAEGEIVGLAGLADAGRTELLETIFGLRPPSAGTIWLHGSGHRRLSPRQAIREDVGLVPGDRRTQGLLLNRSVTENLVAPSTCRQYRLRTPRYGVEADTVRRVCEEMAIHAHDASVAVGTLSGGNQQKVALGKWLAARSRVLLLDEPTRGVDVASKWEIHGLLLAAAQRGAGLLVSSSETPELLTLCHRILVMSRGHIVATLTGAEATEALITKHAGGHV